LAPRPSRYVESPPGADQRCVRVELRGTVQGVGFRPYVFRLATALGLRGEVCNAGGHVVIRAGGPAPAVASFIARLPAEAPPAATITWMAAVDTPPRAVDGPGFRVAVSTGAGGGAVTPDLATCRACLTELFDPTDRRYRYPFATCVDCGPRATVVDDLPYDRERTAMAAFPLCSACSREYLDPSWPRPSPSPRAVG
jgi:hydrogenase maturation protein HypF